ncbi:ATPase P-type K/Mg/Cd/Cu/Zn/Na/Ca/Na/H-transporter [Botryosphaeria dothidea]|uniref:ATPase P-type K/Mg/Cd/Cu/Zn/Na/Ca/Na/H-transporter n=1 Tax=Botryosphaeria dothidea TaxID=55169 RepID=A0A8H4IZE4_9PEZI|nr:ATPase P-type K/Mg/Cd/Cu/Zn/Na/Ca/Na/H-transporter [Botryosphaeria dothidea]
MKKRTIEDSDSANSSVLMHPGFPKHSIIAKTRKTLGSIIGSHHGNNSFHRHGHGHHDHDSLHSHEHGHRFSKASGLLHLCEPGPCGKEESLPTALFVRHDSPDYERGVPAYENIKLSVSGMTCSGCEKSLHKALEKVPSIKDVRTDMATSQAQFCVDVNAIPLEELLHYLRRTTPFGFKHVAEAKEGAQLLDVLLKNPDKLFQGPPPHGVRGITQFPDLDKHGKTKVRIEYYPEVIFPRYILEKALVPDNAELAPIPPPDSVTAGKKQLQREQMYFFISALFTAPVLVLVWAPLSISELTKEAICLVLATAVQLSAWEFYPKAFKSLFHSKMADMDLLIVLSTTTAYVFSVIAFALYVTGSPLSEGSFFETSTLLVTLIRLGRFIGELARQKATESVSIRILQAPTAQLLSEDRFKSRQIDVRLLQRRDIIRIPPHTRIPTDGVVVYGGSQVDESMMTGESRPVAKGIDSTVTAGTMNLDGQLDVSVARMAWENSISKIGTLVENAELTKPKVQALADQIAGLFVPTIFALALTTFIIWLAVGIRVYKKKNSDAIVDAISYAIATLIISCPCAIGLAVPMVIIIASGVAAKHGVIFRVPSAIETTRKVTHVVFDKTGTLTEGKMSVVAEDYLLRPSISTLPHLLGLVSGQKHPVSAAIADFIESKGMRHRTDFDTITVIVGGGIEGKLESEELIIRAGNCDWLGITSSSQVRKFTSRIYSPPSPSADSPIYQYTLDYTLFGITINDELCAIFALRDVLRPETPSVVSTLQSSNIAISIVSGDDARSVEHCARVLNVPANHALSRCSPADKADYVSMLQSAHPEAVVMFLGDGTNDAVALTQANIGVSIAGGTDIAKSAADIVLARPDLRGLPVAMEVSTRAVRRVKFNFAWAAIYNFFAVLLAAGAFVWVKTDGKWASGDDKGALRIPPEFAGLGEIVSVLPVVLIAFSLRFAKFRRSGGQTEEKSGMSEKA